MNTHSYIICTHDIQTHTRTHTYTFLLNACWHTEMLICCKTESSGLINRALSSKNIHTHTHTHTHTHSRTHTHTFLIVTDGWVLLHQTNAQHPWLAISTNTPLPCTWEKLHTHTHTRPIVSATPFSPSTSSSRVILLFSCACSECRCPHRPWLMWLELRSSFCLCVPGKP